MKEYIFDFDGCSFQGLSIGDVVGDNSLGSKSLDKGLGYQVYVKNGSIAGFFFCLNEGYNGYSKFRGLFVEAGAALEISSVTGASDLIKIFGSPSSQWDDGTEGFLEFSLKGGRALEFSWDTRTVEHKLDYLIVE